MSVQNDTAVGRFALGSGLTAVVSSLAVPSLAVAFLAVGLAACSPTVKVEAPSEPITINLNIRLDAEVRVKLEETAREDIEANPDIF